MHINKMKKDNPALTLKKNLNKGGGFECSNNTELGQGGQLNSLSKQFEIDTKIFRLNFNTEILNAFLTVHNLAFVALDLLL